jgi:hypothetical protein
VGIGTSIGAIAIGAILDLAVKVNSPNVDSNTIGLSRMVVGPVGLFVSVLFWNSRGGFGRSYAHRQVSPRLEPYRGRSTSATLLS